MGALKYYDLSISFLFPPTPGSKAGRCVVCGRTTDKGHPVKFSDNFTAWSLLQAGDCICEHCYTLLHNADYRRRSWVASLEGVRFLERKEVLSTLVTPPFPPFAIYITRTGKKQGFLNIINRPATSRYFYPIAFDDMLVWVDWSLLNDMITTARMARARGFTKTDLRNGPRTKLWEYFELCQEIMAFKNHPLWEVVVYAIE